MSPQMRQQWLHGFLELGLLALLAERRDYGRGLIERMVAAGFDEVPGGTLYPSLLRLEKQGLVRTEWESSTSGPRRKYYELSAAGHRAVVERTQSWIEFRSAIDAVTAVAHAPHMERT